MISSLVLPIGIFLFFFILFLIPVFLQYKGIINPNIKITQTITILIMMGFLSYFIYISIHDNNIKDNLIIMRPLQNETLKNKL